MGSALSIALRYNLLDTLEVLRGEGSGEETVFQKGPSPDSLFPQGFLEWLVF